MIVYPNFIWIKALFGLTKKNKRINKYTIRYMINTDLNVNIALREQVEKFIKNTFGAITQPFIKATFKKKGNKSVIIIKFL